MTDEEREKQREQFAAIPTDRTFCQIKLYLDTDGKVTGMVWYDGKVLKALQITDMQGMVCRTLAEAVRDYAQRAVYAANEAVEISATLRQILTGKDSDDSKDSNSDEGCGQPDCPIHHVHRDS